MAIRLHEKPKDVVYIQMTHYAAQRGKGRKRRGGTKTLTLMNADLEAVYELVSRAVKEQLPMTAAPTLSYGGDLGS